MAKVARVLMSMKPCQPAALALNFEPTKVMLTASWIATPPMSSSLPGSVGSAQGKFTVTDR